MVQHLDREKQHATGSQEIHHRRYHKFTAESSQLVLPWKSEERAPAQVQPRANKCHLQPRWRLRETEEKHWRSRAGRLEGALTYQPTCITLSECASDRSSRLSTAGGDAERSERRAALCASGAPGLAQVFLSSSCLLSPPLTRLRCVQRDLGEPH